LLLSIKVPKTEEFKNIKMLPAQLGIYDLMDMQFVSFLKPLKQQCLLEVLRLVFQPELCCSYGFFFLFWLLFLALKLVIAKLAFPQTEGFDKNFPPAVVFAISGHHQWQGTSHRRPR
jgi:hypothetical protein